MSRTKGARNVRTIVHELAAMKIVIKDANGESRKVTVLEALIMKAQHLAMTGNIAANKHIDRMRSKLVLDDQKPPGILLAPKIPSKAEWIRRAKIANGLAERPDMPGPELEPLPGSEATPKRDGDSSGPGKQPPAGPGRSYR